MSKKFKDFFLKDTPGRCLVSLLALGIIVLQRALRGNTALMRRLSADFVRPLHRRLSVLTDRVPFSIAELLILLAAAFVLLQLGRTVLRLIREGERLRTLGLFVMSVGSLVLAVYAGFCILWGVFYYGDDFVTRAGFETRPISTEELESVTAYFAKLANRYSAEVPRDAEGVCASDRLSRGRAPLRRTGGPAGGGKAVFLFPAAEPDGLFRLFLPLYGGGKREHGFSAAPFRRDGGARAGPSARRGKGTGGQFLRGVCQPSFRGPGLLLFGLPDGLYLPRQRPVFFPGTRTIAIRRA